MSDITTLATWAIQQLRDVELLAAAAKILRLYEGDRKPYFRMYALAEKAGVDKEQASYIVEVLTGALLLESKSAGVCKSGLWDQAYPVFRRKASGVLSKQLREEVA